MYVCLYLRISIRARGHIPFISILFHFRFFRLLITSIFLIHPTPLSFSLVFSFFSVFRKANAVVDGRLVTAQNHQSSLEIAQRVLDVLRSLGEKFSAPENVNKPWGA